jgi:tetratricopeptide (TPR) repeat protein
MPPVHVRGVWLAALFVLIASPSASSAAQSGSTASTVALDDSVFLPIRSPATISFGYPPNDIFLPRIIEQMRRQQFDSLDAMFGELAADVRRDVRNEVRLADAFEAAERDEPELLAHLDVWIAARPSSAHARVARARYRLAEAWRRRGGAYIRDTPPERLRGMQESATKAFQDVVAALRVDSTHMIAYETGIDLMQLAGSHEAAFQLMERGLAMHPGSYGLPKSFVGMLWPRWGGSEELMMKFAERAAQDSARNPRLVTLRGAVNETRAYDSTLAGNYAGAVREMNKALAYGPERLYLRARGKAYFRLGAYEYAFNDLRAVIIERSQDKEALDYYGRTLVQLATRARPGIRSTILDRAVEVLTLASYLDPSNTNVRAALDRAMKMAGK